MSGELHLQPRQPGDPPSKIGLIEFTRDPALFFHAEKYRGSLEPVRTAIMAAESPAAAESILAANPLTAPQRVRWQSVRERVLACATWFSITQHPEQHFDPSPSRFDGLDAQASVRRARDLRARATRLVITGSRSLAARAAAYALIDWFVTNRALAPTGHGILGSVDEVLSGNANGSEAIGEEWAMRQYIPVAHIPALPGPPDGEATTQADAAAARGTQLLAFDLDEGADTTKLIEAFVRAKKPYWRFTEKDVRRMSQIVAR